MQQRSFVYAIMETLASGSVGFMSKDSYIKHLTDFVLTRRTDCRASRNCGTMCFENRSMFELHNVCLQSVCMLMRFRRYTTLTGRENDTIVFFFRWKCNKILPNR